MVRPVPPDGIVRELKFIDKGFPPAYIQERLMLSMDFVEELQNRAPVPVIVVKHANPAMGDFETQLAMPPDRTLYSLYNDGKTQHWRKAGTVNFR